MKLWEFRKKFGVSKNKIINLSILIYHSDYESLVIQRKCLYWEYDRFIFYGQENYEVVHLQINEEDLAKIVQNPKYDHATVRVQPININLGNKIKRMVKYYGG